jgi:hypothetical protein
VSKQKRKQLKKLKYLQPKNHDYIFLVAICNILADQKTTQSSSSQSSSSQAITEKTKLQSYIRGGYSDELLKTTNANQKVLLIRRDYTYYY